MFKEILAYLFVAFGVMFFILGESYMTNYWFVERLVVACACLLVGVILILSIDDDDEMEDTDGERN